MPVSSAHQVAVLFARRDSPYKQIASCDVYDIDRDARSYPGGLPVIAHPPCRAWGRLAHRSRPMPHEKSLADFALSCVRRNGGVLEHPMASKFWRHARLPLPGWLPDEYGGITIQIDQCDFGHPARKATWLYIVGVPFHLLPAWPEGQGVPTHCITSSIRPFPLPEVSRYWREATPPVLAHWLIQVARLSAQLAKKNPPPWSAAGGSLL